MNDRERMNVPVEPTDAMLDAAVVTGIADMSALYRGERDTYRHLWRAMLGASATSDGASVKSERT